MYEHQQHPVSCTNLPTTQWIWLLLHFHLPSLTSGCLLWCRLTWIHATRGILGNPVPAKPRWHNPDPPQILICWEKEMMECSLGWQTFFNELAKWSGQYGGNKRSQLPMESAGGRNEKRGGLRERPWLRLQTSVLPLRGFLWSGSSFNYKDQRKEPDHWISQVLCSSKFLILCINSSVKCRSAIVPKLAMAC